VITGGLLLHRQLDGGLAGSHAFGRQTLSAAAARQAHPHVFHFAVDRFLQQAAVGIGHGDRMVDHFRQYGIERQLGMQQRRGFQEHVQFPQAAAGGLRTRHVVNARQ